MKKRVSLSDDNNFLCKKELSQFYLAPPGQREALEPSTSANWVTYFSGLSLKQDI